MEYIKKLNQSLLIKNNPKNIFPNQINSKMHVPNVSYTGFNLMK